MKPEPWSIDDMSDEEYAAWEAEPDPNAEWMDNMKSWVGANLKLPNWWEDDHPGWLAIALWKIDQGHQLNGRDLEALSKAGKAYQLGDVVPRPRGRQAVVVTPKMARERQLKAAFLKDQGVAKKVAAQLLGIGVKPEDVDALAAGAHAKSFSFPPVHHLDVELMEKIAKDYRREVKIADMMGNPLKGGGR